MSSTDIDGTINFCTKQLIESNINEEQIAIVNNLSTLLSVKSGNHYINDFTVIKANCDKSVICLLIMYICANLFSYNFYIEIFCLSYYYLHFICLVYHYVYESHKYKKNRQYFFS